MLPNDVCRCICSSYCVHEVDCARSISMSRVAKIGEPKEDIAWEDDFSRNLIAGKGCEHFIPKEKTHDR